MSQRDWGIYVAAGLIAGGAIVLVSMVWIIGLNYCPGSPCTYNEGQAQNPTDNEDWLPFASGPNTTSGLEPEDTKGHEKYYERQDLRAQESVARATNALVWLTSISIVLGVGGALLLVWTLIETRLNNDITREGTFTQTRAWLSCDVKLTKQKIDPSENGVRWTAVATCKNFGVSPALGVSFFARIQASPRGKTLAEHMEEFAKSTVDSTVHGEAVFPNGGGDYTYFVVMDNADIEDTLKRDNYQTIFPILYGCVNYRIPGSQVIHQTMFGYYVLNVVAGRRYLPGPSYPEWLLRPMEVTRPGIVKAT